MDLIFGKPKTARELMRECDKAVRMATSDLERHRKKMGDGIKAAKVRAKRAARNGDEEEARMQVRMAAQQTAMTRRVGGLILNLKNVQTQVKMAGASNAMVQVMRKAVKAMFIVNQQVPLPMIPRLMQEFERQKDAMEMKEELMNEALEDAVGGDDTIDAAANEIMDQIYAELDLESLKAMPTVHHHGPGQTQSGAEFAEERDVD